MVVSKRWFVFCLDIEFRYPPPTSIEPPFCLNLTSSLPLFNLNLTSASSGISNHGLETTVYIPLEITPWHETNTQIIPQGAGANTGAACLCTDMNSPPKYEKYEENSSSKIFSCIGAGAITGPACIGAKINSPRNVSCMYWFCAGGNSHTHTQKKKKENAMIFHLPLILLSLFFWKTARKTTKKQ